MIPRKTRANRAINLLRSAREALPNYPSARGSRKNLCRNVRDSGEKFPPRLFAVFVALAAQLLELCKHSTDIELARLFDGLA